MKAPHFVPEEAIRDLAMRVFEHHKDIIGRLLPDADMQHVGGTAVPGAVTKGDVDLSVRVPENGFQNAIRALQSVYAIHQPDNWTATYASFKDETRELPVGVQLSVRHSRDDHFVATRDLLRGDSHLLTEYNDLKSAYENQDEEAYVAAKAQFMEKVLRERLNISRRP